MSLASAPATPEAGQRRGLVRAVSKTLTGAWLTAAARLVLFAVLAKTAGLAAVGAWGLGAGIADPIFKLFNMGLRTVHATDVARERRFAEVLRIRLVTIGAALALSVGIVALANPGALVQVALAAVVARAAESLGDIALGEFQRSRRFGLIALSGAMRLLVTLGPVAWIATGGALVPGLFALAGGLSLVALYEAALAAWVARGHERGRPIAPSGGWRALILAAGHVGLVGATVAFLTNVNRYVAAGFGGLADVGVLTAAALLVALGQVAIRGLSLAFLPLLSALPNRRGWLDAQVTRLQLAAILIMIVVGLAVGIGGSGILQWVFNDELAAATPLVGGLLAVAGLRYAAALQNNRVLATQKFDLQTRWLPLYLGVAGLASVAGIGLFGLWGAVLANAVIWAVVLTVRKRILATFSEEGTR